ncbi:hypothetical protein EB796_019979 [Bugula neritina]|uniref:TIR domain-containing protein n=1 Tax=Bugula neritina TaxID=10212 RepID=A0A7J7J7I2_BUGNE|nr:hypothetical protein EB796_019979 [Bugula neritina]
MDCSDTKITQFSVPPTLNTIGIRVLKLNHNHLNSIPDLSPFTDLEFLDLSYNKISFIGPFIFSSNTRLLHLNISFNNSLLSNETISRDSFKGLTTLKTLRLKQKDGHKPAQGFDYSALAPLNNSLEELYLIGTPAFSSVFTEFHRLHTLSIGGSDCDVPELTDISMSPLSSLPLKRFSARNCRVNSINQEFLKSFTNSLLRLDLSCNPLKEHFSEIFNGIANSKLHTLLLDHINIPEKDTDFCWWGVSNDDIRPFSTIPLQVLSMQANHIQTPTTLNLREYCQGLLYLDISQNELNHSSLQVSSNAEGQKLSSSVEALFYNIELQTPFIRYIAFRGMTKDYSCDGHNYYPDLLDCNQDSYLFTEDRFDWNITHNPDIVDIHVLTKIKKYLHVKCSQDIFTFLLCLHEENVIYYATDYIRKEGIDYVSDEAVDFTIRYYWDRVRTLLSGGLNFHFVPAHLTTLAIDYNDFTLSEDVRRNEASSLSSDIEMYLNNLETITSSYSQVGFLSLRNTTGYQYLSKLVCTDCGINGWSGDLLTNFPIKTLELSKNKLGEKLRNDIDGELLEGAPALEELYLGQQSGGISYFSNFNFLSHHPNLTHLDLYGNELLSWNITISKNFKLIYLNLINNSIHYIEEEFRNEFDNQSLNNNFYVDLTGNTVLCSNNESHVNYIHWLLTSPAVKCDSQFYCYGLDMTISDYYDSLAVSTSTDSSCGQSEQLVTISVSTAIATVLVLFLIAMMYFNRHSLLLRFYQNKLLSSTAEECKAFASHTNGFTVKLIELLSEIKCFNITITSSEMNTLPGEMSRLATAKLIAQSGKSVIFVTPDYMKDDVTKFEFELIKLKPVSELLVVTVGISSVSQLDHLPKLLTRLIMDKKHLEWPVGVCSTSAGSHNREGFIKTLVETLSNRSSEVSNHI